MDAVNDQGKNESTNEIQECVRSLVISIKVNGLKENKWTRPSFFLLKRSPKFKGLQNQVITLIKVSAQNDFVCKSINI